jgi:hypothetical protein
MKNFKIAMILVAVVALFSSCKKEGPSITFAEKDGIVTFDLSEASSKTLNFDGSVTAEAGIETLKVTQTILDARDTVVKAFEISLTEDPAGQTEYSLNFSDILKKVDTENGYSLANGYSVVYDVECVDKKEQTDTKSWTVAITETATPLSANWSNPIILSNQSWATYNGAACQEENEVIGVHAIGQDASRNYKARPTTGASWVFVESIENLTSNEALVEAFNNGSPITGEYEFPTDPIDKSHPYSQLYFISHNAAGEYVLVDYMAGQNSNTTGNVLVFQYKKAETSTPSAK